MHVFKTGLSGIGTTRASAWWGQEHGKVVGAAIFTRWVAALWLASLGSFAGYSSAATVPQSYVKEAASCDGFPRVVIETAPGFSCCGDAASPSDTVKRRAAPWLTANAHDKATPIARAS